VLFVPVACGSHVSACLSDVVVRVCAVQTWIEKIQRLEKELDWAREMADR
jgi:hypothetical protein